MRLVLPWYVCAALLGAASPSIPPQIAVDERGAVHMIYYRGPATGGDLFYVRSSDGLGFSEPIPVNTNPGSAVAAGNIRGAHIALGKNGTVHVAWMGSKSAQPK